MKKTLKNLKKNTHDQKSRDFEALLLEEKQDKDLLRRKTDAMVQAIVECNHYVVLHGGFSHFLQICAGKLIFPRSFKPISTKGVQTNVLVTLQLDVGGLGAEPRLRRELRPLVQVLVQLVRVAREHAAVTVETEPLSGVTKLSIPTPTSNA